MPSSPTSQTATSLLTILNNINELVTIANDKAKAKEVMKAFKIYADNKSFPVNEDKVDGFQNVLLDARPSTLSSILQDIASDIMSVERKRNQKKKPKLIS